MQLITDEIKGYLSNASWIRKMFEAGLELKKQYGDDNVYDFSIGNPDLPPPPAVKAALGKITERAGLPFAIGYMPNAGYPDLRGKLAAHLSREQNVELPGSNVIMTCGAAGGINVFFRAVLSAGDEVICPAPYFVEYGFYAANSGGRLVPVKSKDFTFELDLDAIEKAFTPKTRAVIINTPNNPTGQIYSRGELVRLAEIIAAAEKKFGRVIYVISDEPYRFLNFDGVELPGALEVFPHSVVIGSYSKNLSLAGERLGYIAVSPKIEQAGELIAGLILCNRILGFVNAPALAQQILSECMESQVDLDIYRERRDAMADVLSDAGIEFSMPRGAFYFFPKSPVADESAFIQALVEERVLAVPGRGFGCPGYVRFAFCVGTKVIEGARQSIKNAVKKLK
ncbi:MAG: pyridoxal phosphate-dependent aminotransferase [Lentisphaeria bacterium]|nr:pyridoxal phosphate-dependent aminotransferase [Lentisphaeria bacterium]